MKTIVTDRHEGAHGAVYKAWFADAPGQQEFGPTKAEAVGRLVMRRTTLVNSLDDIADRIIETMKEQDPPKADTGPGTHVERVWGDNPYG